jgi:hypothetical protein
MRFWCTQSPETVVANRIGTFQRIIALAVIALSGGLSIAANPADTPRGGAPADSDEGETPARLEPAPPTPAIVGPPPAEPPIGGAATGHLRVLCESDGAEIHVDGRYIGDAPALITLTTGRHIVEIRADGRDPWTSEIEVEAGKRVVLQVPF